MKKLLSILLVLLMTAAVLPMGAIAAEGQGLNKYKLERRFYKTDWP